MAKYKRPHKPSAQKKPPLTHFLCLPLVTPTSKPQLEASLAKFKDHVTSTGSTTPGIAEAAKSEVSTDETVLPLIHPKAIRPVGALHCTLGVMSLKQNELKEAVELLNALDVQTLLQGDTPVLEPAEGTKAAEQGDGGTASLQRPITPPQVDRSIGPLTVDLKGLESMHAPQKTSILYTAPSDASERLYDFCLAVQKTFKDRDLLVEDDRALKLHATIVNTIYAKGKKRPARASAAEGRGQASSATGTDEGHGPNANAPLKIDAIQLLEKYKDYTWAENVVLNRIAICEMGAKKVLDDQGNVKAEEYTEIASIALPT